MKKEIDYGKYRLSVLEEIRCVLFGGGVAVIVAWLVYASAYGMLVMVLTIPFIRMRYQQQCCRLRKRVLLLQFKDVMQSVATALTAGYSMENAWIEAEQEVRMLHGEDADITVELQRMNQGVATSQQIEVLLYEFAIRSECEDVISFAEVFHFAKRSGGDFRKMIQNTIVRISEKIELEQELQTVISGKKLEQRVMNVVPVILLAYLRLTSVDFLKPLYGNLFGVVVMTLAMAGYMVAVWLGEKMMDALKLS